MFGLNNAQLIGRLGADATISHLTNGGRVANVSIATDESYLDKNSGLTRWTAPSGTASSPSFFGNGSPSRTDWHTFLLSRQGFNKNRPFSAIF